MRIDDGSRSGRIGTALAMGAQQTVLQVAGVVVNVKRLVTGQTSARDLGG